MSQGPGDMGTFIGLTLGSPPVLSPQTHVQYG
jgi:hypothetical protein